MGSDSGLWIEPSIDLSELIVEQNGLWIKGVFQASNRVIWYRSDQVILSCNGQSWIKHGHVKLATSWAVVGLRAGAYEGLDGTMWFDSDGPIFSFKEGIRKRHAPPGSWFVDVTTTSDGRV